MGSYAAGLYVHLHIIVNCKKLIALKYMDFTFFILFLICFGDLAKLQKIYPCFDFSRMVEFGVVASEYHTFDALLTFTPDPILPGVSEADN